jgi:5'-3' exonuclease
VDPNLLAQFPLAEEALSALGVVVWSMVEFEADDAIASAVKRFKKSKSVEQIVIGSPDKDLAQLVSGDRTVCWDRRREVMIDEAGVVEKFGVSPESIPDWLAVVGDSADGYPGIQGWGAKSASAVLSQYRHLEEIPHDPTQWQVSSISAGRAASLVQSLSAHWQEALLFRKLALLRQDVPLQEKISDLQWRGANPGLKEFCLSLGDEKFTARVPKWR